jgi:hypothetical protein
MLTLRMRWGDLLCCLAFAHPPTIYVFVPIEKLAEGTSHCLVAINVSGFHSRLRSGRT